MTVSKKMTRRAFIGASVTGSWALAWHSSAAEDGTLVRLQSSSLAAAGYDAGTQILQIEFRSGALYRYRGVPRTVFRDLVQAESKGRFFTAQIRGKFNYEMIRGPRQ
jgi:KTSC domain